MFQNVYFFIDVTWSNKWTNGRLLEEHREEDPK